MDNTAVTEQKEYVLAGNNKLYARRKDPYGLIHLSLERGALPEKIREPSSWTSFQAAEVTIQEYIRQHNEAFAKTQADLLLKEQLKTEVVAEATEKAKKKAA